MIKQTLLVCTLVLFSLTAAAQRKGADTVSVPGIDRIEEVMRMVDGKYVDAPDMNKLSEAAVVAMLKSLDPHSVYISAKDVQRANESLNGSFDGVGVSFQILHDTIILTDIIEQGPSEKAGLMIGDKVIRVDGLPAVGDSIDNAFVYKHFRGAKGTKVQVDVLRQGVELSYTITRGKVPVYSVTTHFLDRDSIGYINLVRFSLTSATEFRRALADLQRQGMKALILDLRGNGGGYMEIAVKLADEFLDAKKLIVYQEGRKQRRDNKVSTASGKFINGHVVVLIDEQSASASEIVSGALQDWDRATIIGRRSFGKGLVQRKYKLSDGGELRLTTARYYTPSGRCIQRPYAEGTDAYRRDLEQRYRHNEMVNQDSIHLNDSLQYKTHRGRTVYGGGGIMPDIFVPMDTMKLSDYCVAVRNKALTDFVQEWSDSHRQEWSDKGFEAFLSHYEALDVDRQLETYAHGKGIGRDTVAEAQQPHRTTRSDQYLHHLVKARIARNIFGMEYYYRVMKDIDDAYQKAITVLTTGEGRM